MNLNKVFLIGRVTGTPEVRDFQSGKLAASFGLATNLTYTDKNGAKQEQVEFHNVIFWGNIANVVKQYVLKGTEVLVEGRITTRRWKDKQGNDRVTTEIAGERLQLGAKPKSYGAPAQEEELPPAVGGGENGDDIPF